MDLNLIRDLAIENQKSITALDEWAQAMEKRVSVIEAANNVLTSVQITLTELSANYKFFGEKLSDMKQSLEEISRENKKQHDDLGIRIKKLEDQPAEKWNKATWSIITLTLGAIVGYILTFIVPK